MSDAQSEHFNETNAPYADPTTFTSLWNSMSAERRRNNSGLFVLVFKRVPSDTEIEHGIPTATQN